MTNKLVTAEAQAISLAPVQMSQSDAFLLTIQQAASDTSVDMDKRDRLYAMYKDVKAEEGKVLYNKAMATAQAEMPGIEKKHINPQTRSNYAKIEDIIRAIKPVWTANGFSLSFYPADSHPDGFITVKCDVSHASGETRTFSYDSPIDDKGIGGKVNKTQTHGRASAMTYGERYLIGMVFALEVGFQGQDNDGNQPVAKITKEQAEELIKSIHDADIDIARVRAWMKQTLKVEEFEDINVAAYEGVQNKIKASAKAVQQREPGSDDDKA